MLTILLGSLAITAYTCAFVIQASHIRLSSGESIRLFQLPLLPGIVLHAAACYFLIFTSEGLELGLLRVFSVVALAVNTILLILLIKKPVQNLFLFLLPISILILLAALFSPSTKLETTLDPGLRSHILASIVAYSLMVIAALQSILLGYQNWLLRNKHMNRFLRTLPPLQTMESLLFEFLWAAIVFLSLSLVTGFLFFEDLKEQQLIHKTVFSIIAWIVYAILLWGRITLGWRGNTAIRWTLAGFIAILLGYVGSKFVLEYLL